MKITIIYLLFITANYSISMYFFNNIISHQLLNYEI